MEGASWVIPVVTALLSGGLVAILKIRPETGQIVVRSAESVVIMQKGLLDTLQGEMDELRFEHTREMALLRHEIDKQKVGMAELRAELSETKTQRDELAQENRALKSEVTRLERRVAELEAKS